MQASALAIVDHEVPSPDELRRHPELGAGRDGERLLVCFDAGRAAPRLPLNGAHALLCASVAGGRLTGIHPQAHLLFLGSAESDADQADLLLWAAGLPAAGRMSGLPPPPIPAGVFSISVQRGPLHPRLADAYRKIALLGRGGRGALLCFSAGNLRENLPADRPDLASPHLLRIGASCRQPDGSEQLCTYSARGPGLHLCAPSSPELGSKTSHLFADGPRLAGVPRHCGRFGFETLAETRLLAAAPAGATSLDVESSADFLPGSPAWVEQDDGVLLLSVFDTRPGRLILRRCPEALRAGVPIRSACRRLASIAKPRQGGETLLHLDRPLDVSALPTPVLLGGPDQEIGGYEEVEVIAAAGRQVRLARAVTSWRPHFNLALDESHWAPSGGTSLATPFVAGLASLILGLDPKLPLSGLIDLLVHTSLPLMEHREYPGARRVDAAAAIRRLRDLGRSAGETARTFGDP